jgi:hypothetical protein
MRVARSSRRLGLDVADDHVRLEVSLPWLLQRFAEAAQTRSNAAAADEEKRTRRSATASKNDLDFRKLLSNQRTEIDSRRRNKLCRHNIRKGRRPLIPTFRFGRLTAATLSRRLQGAEISLTPRPADLKQQGERYLDSPFCRGPKRMALELTVPSKTSARPGRPPCGPRTIS